MPGLVNTFVFVEPLGHYLEYGSKVLHDLVLANSRTGQTIVELIGDQATPENVKQALSTNNPIFFAGVGHGNTDVYSVESTAILVRATSPEIELFKDKIVSLTSCLTAQILGPAIIDAGALAYTGYKEEFWFYIADPAGSTKAVRSPFEATFQFEVSMLQGKTTGDARQAQMSKYDDEIAYWTTGAGKDDADALEISRILEMNKSNSVFFGQNDAVATPGGLPTELGALAPWMVVPPIIAIGYLMYRDIFR